MEGAKPKLGYWAIYGAAQPSRYLLEYLGADYEEERYTPETAKVWFEEHKANLGLDFPNLPYYLDGDVKITESMAILRHIARKNKPDLLGKDLAEKAKFENLFFLFANWKTDLAGHCYKDNHEELKPKLLEAANKKLEQLDKVVGAAWLVGEQFTVADILAFDSFEFLLLIEPSALDAYKNIAGWRQRFVEQDWYKKYVASGKLPEHVNAPGYAKINNK